MKLKRKILSCFMACRKAHAAVPETGTAHAGVGSHCVGAVCGYGFVVGGGKPFVVGGGKPLCLEEESPCG
eukprot:280963-Chlamydomonas_euryale.AAC.2